MPMTIRSTGKRLCSISIAIFLVTCAVGCDSDSSEVVTTLPDFDLIWEEAAARYQHFELKAIDWTEVRARLRPIAESATGTEAVDVLADLLAELKDPHVTITISGRRRVPYLSVRTVRDEGAFDPSIARDMLISSETLASGDLEYGMLPNDIGYIRLKTFLERVDADFDTALLALEQATGMIIDVRANSGGALDVLTAVPGRFTDQAFTGIPVFILGEPTTRPVVTPTGPLQYLKPTVVLSDGKTVSAGESFTETMKQIKSVVVIGDTTAGAGGAFSEELPGIIELSRGIKAAIPTAETRHFDGTALEWNGVAPDIRVEQSATDAAAGMDKQLEFAISYLLSGGN